MHVYLQFGGNGFLGGRGGWVGGGVGARWVWGGGERLHGENILLTL